LLLALINDILDVSKLEAGKIVLESVAIDLELLCQDVFKMIMPGLKDKPIETSVLIDPGVPRLVKADPTRMRQVLVNLVSNSVKFTKTGTIAITISSARYETPRSGYTFLEIHVTDTGIGVPEDKKDIIFSPFTQSDDSTTRQFGGTGLGLTICRSIVEAMGGCIRVESEEGKGSDFIICVELPIADLPTSEAILSESITNQSGVRESGDRGLRVLVAEDNHTNQMLMREYLDMLKVKSEFVANGQEAVQRLMENRYDLCFMDIQMPVMDGLEATRIVRERISKELPVIGLSAAVMSADTRKGFDAGLSDYLKKPVDIDQISDVIDKWAGKK
jgi:CheY-like chemotaxis protein